MDSSSEALLSSAKFPANGNSSNELQYIPPGKNQEARLEGVLPVMEVYRIELKGPQQENAQQP